MKTKFWLTSLLLLVLVQFHSSATAESINWYDDATSAISDAKKMNKPLLHFFYHKNIPRSRTLEKELNNSNEFIELSQSFICYREQITSGEGIYEEFDIFLLPTVVIMTPENKEETRFEYDVSLSDITKSMMKYKKPGTVSKPINNQSPPKKVIQKQTPAPTPVPKPVNNQLAQYADVLGFENINAWKGATADSNDPKQGSTSGLWSDTIKLDRIEATRFPSDLSAFSKMSIQVHSKKATYANIGVIFYSENGATDNIDYYRSNFPIDFSGWKQVIVDLKYMKEIREPQGWDKISGFMFVSQKYGVGDAHPETVLKFDDIKFLP